MKRGQTLKGGLGCLLGIMILLPLAYLNVSLAAEPAISAPADETATQNHATLRQVRSAIETRGARWVAADTSISRLPHEMRLMKVGAIRPQLTGREQVLPAKATRAASAASGADWRSFNSKNYVTPVRDQGSCGSCWAFSTTAALESYTLIQNNTPDVNLDLSEQVLVSCGQAGNCKGGWPDRASDYLKSSGLPLESCYPYTALNGSCYRACSNWKATAYKINDWVYVTQASPTANALKNALDTYGPLSTLMNVYTDFYYYRSGVYEHTTGSIAGAHAVLMVGYNDTGRYFIVKNSWGTGWGENGFFRISYSELDSDVNFGDFTIAYRNNAGLPYLDKWGTRGSGEGQFLNPSGIAADRTGNIYVADTDNHRIQRFGLDGVYLGEWGAQGAGDGQFQNPAAIAVGADGAVFVADSGNHRVQKLNADGTFAWTRGSQGSGEGQFQNPSGITVDANGFVYVADTGNHRIQKLNTDGTFAWTRGSPGSGEGFLRSPWGIAVDADGFVYVADSENNRIQKFTSGDGNFVASWGEEGSADADFRSPRGLAVDSSGFIYVVDGENKRIQKFNADGIYITRFGASGTGNGQLSDPRSIAVDAYGNICVIDAGMNQRVQRFGYGRPACSYTVTPTSISLPATTGTGTVNVGAGLGCSWTAVSNASWITLTSGESGTGTGTVQFSVAENTGVSQRSGTLSIAGRTVTVTQSGIVKMIDLYGAWTGVSSVLTNDYYMASGNIMITNTGSTRVSSVRVNVYLSTDSSFGTGDRYLGYRTIGPVNAGSSKSELVRFRVTDKPSGKYLVGVIDPSNLIREENEVNNTFIGAIP